MRESYTKDFIQTIIDLYNSGKSVTDLSVEYGIKKVTIYSWINQNKPALKVDDEELSKSDIIALKKRIMELEEENEILKKALPYSRKENDNWYWFIYIYGWQLIFIWYYKNVWDF